MTRCSVCGKNILLLSTDIGSLRFCRNCAARINLNTWKNRVFSSIEELISEKNSALQLATINCFPDTAIQEIEKYFNEYMNSEYLTGMDGKAGQTLKVFDAFCIIETKDEDKKTALSSAFHQFIDDDDDSNNIEESILSSHKSSIINGLISGRLIQTGVGLMASAVIDSKEKEMIEERKVKERNRNLKHMIRVGEHKVLLKDVECVDTYSAPNTLNGYLRFIPKNISPKDYYSCVYFFFNNSIPFESKRIKQRVDEIANILNAKIASIELENDKCTAEQPKPEHENHSRESTFSSAEKPDPFEEIRKYKVLLDDGILTEEEFNKKKKELLGI